VRTAAVAFLLSTIAAAALTPLIRSLALRLGVLDQALSSRKIHGRPVPRLGGIAIVVAFYAPLVGLFVFQSDVGAMFVTHSQLVLGLFLGGPLIAALGIYDDLRGAGAAKKFLVQFAVAGLMYALGFRIDTIANPFGSQIVLGWAALPFTLLWIVGVINAMNLIDGLDGLAGGVALVAVATTFLMSLERGHPLMILFCAALAGSILGFLFYNFNPASIFMGDTGSMFLGFILAVTALRTGQKSSTAVAVLIPAMALGLPILDTLLAMSRRAVRGQPVFRADREHIHHRLLAIGLSHRQAVLVLYGFCLVFGAVALVLTYTSSVQTGVLLAVLGALSVFLLRRLGYMRVGTGPSLVERRRRNLALRSAVRPLAGRLAAAASYADVWEVVRDAASVFDASGVRLELARRFPGGDQTQVVFEAALGDRGEETGSVLRRARYSLNGIREHHAFIELGWPGDRAFPTRDAEILIELFCDHTAEACERLRPVEASERAPAGDVVERA
jgi:UDP-GlcNAc:undecaprenyl-phosphate GlcNAc-1-phosphate transferase